MHALFVHMRTQWQTHTTVALQMHKIPRGHRERTLRVLVCMSGCLFGCVVHFRNTSLAIFRMAREKIWTICTQTLTYTFMFTGVQISHTHSETHSSFTCLYGDYYIIEHTIHFKKRGWRRQMFVCIRTHRSTNIAYILIDLQALVISASSFVHSLLLPPHCALATGSHLLHTNKQVYIHTHTHHTRKRPLSSSTLIPKDRHHRKL